ncbi:hypothetical protein PI124_g10856 [Phytophthora idaei]|nr:hypothetical protein PI126_g17016 [Phytophthora idaei]KAG3244367.1 hypothetical protein PI124_g10856 [Phytophthora idaei]
MARTKAYFPNVAVSLLKENLDNHCLLTMSTTYFYFRPGAFNVVRFAYGKAEGTVSRGGKIKAKHVQRWRRGITKVKVLN